MTNEVEKAVTDKLQEIISIEGNIKKYSKFGNSIIIVFDNGKYYHQPFISLYSSKATLDVLPLSNSKELKPTVEYSNSIASDKTEMISSHFEATKEIDLKKIEKFVQDWINGFGDEGFEKSDIPNEGYWYVSKNGRNGINLGAHFEDLLIDFMEENGFSNINSWKDELIIEKDTEISQLKQQLKDSSDCVQHMHDAEKEYQKDIEGLKKQLADLQQINEANLSHIEAANELCKQKDAELAEKEEKLKEAIRITQDINELSQVSDYRFAEYSDIINLWTKSLLQTLSKNPTN